MPRQKSILPYKRPKEFHEAGRHYKRVEGLLAKRDKLHMMEAIVTATEKKPDHDREYVRDLKRRANEVRSQLAVLSTTNWKERP